jgi:hypothetical protein
MKHNRKSQRGAIIPLFAVILPALVGALGLAVDTGAMFDENRRMQTAADAAAIAAAQEMRTSNFTGFESAALEDAALNGYPDGDEIDVEVNRPPTTGPRAGDGRFVEVFVRRPAPSYFMSLFTAEPRTLTARAVAGVEPANACVYALNPSEEASFDASGSSHVLLEDCAIQVNSAHASAAVADGSAQVEAVSINVTGDYEGAGFFPQPFTGVPVQADPLAEFEPPAWSTSCDEPKQVMITSSTTLDPGTYCGGFLITSTGVVTFNPGVYIIKGGGFTAHGGARVEGSGVTFVLTEGAGKPYSGVFINGGVTVTLSAPTSGYWKGILWYQDPDISSNVASDFTGTGALDMKGVVYFPTTELNFSGTFVGHGQELMVIGDTVHFDGNSIFHKLGDDFIPNALTFARVVE